MEKSTTTLQLKWGQEPNVQKYRVKIIELDIERELDLVNGWEQTFAVDLEPGTLYNLNITAVSYDKSSETVWMSDSTYPSPPTEIAPNRTYDDKNMIIWFNTTGRVEVNGCIFTLT